MILFVFLNIFLEGEWIRRVRSGSRERNEVLPIGYLVGKYPKDPCGRQGSRWLGRGSHGDGERQ